MRSILYVVAVVLVVLFLIGLLTGNNLGLGNVIWVLLVLAIISLLLGVIRRGA